jgi:redox-sensitive bicupin YhaK (pirin superfamily)
MGPDRTTRGFAMSTSTIDVRRAGDRFHTDMGWLDSRHSFSFGGHWDPANTGHGLLIVSNDDRVAPGGGFGAHPHRDMEIVTWVLEGALEHTDSAGNTGVIVPGHAQRMSAGTGIVHSEMNHSATEPVHFLQMWVVPERTGLETGYEQVDLTARLDAGGLVTVASGGADTEGVHINQPGATLRAARMAGGDTVAVPEDPCVHLFVALGAVRLGDTLLDEGDAVRLTSATGLDVTAPKGSEILLWSSDAEVRR